MRYVALDFETGNAYYTSACSVGVAVFEDHRIVNQYVRLIRPPESVGAFHWYNVKIHGIHQNQLINEPSFDQVWSNIEKDIEGSVLICHNAMFDTAVLCKCLEFYELPLPCCRYICTVKVSQRMWPHLNNHKLDTVAASLNISLNHHEAGSDALAAGLILQAAMQQANVKDVDELSRVLGIRLGIISPERRISCSSAQQSKNTASGKVPITLELMKDGGDLI